MDSGGVAGGAGPGEGGDVDMGQLGPAAVAAGQEDQADPGDQGDQGEEGGQANQGPVEEAGAGQAYRVAIGNVLKNFSPETVLAWRREEARGWVTSNRAHRVLRAMDASTPGNSFRKQMATMPEALVPMYANRANAITVVRHAAEAGYVTRFKQARRDTHGILPAPPLASYVIMAPPFLEQTNFCPDHASLVITRHHRDKNGFLLGWHQQEFPSCPQALRGVHFLRVPAWWRGVEVPFGAMVELPVVQCYFEDLLKNHDPFAWCVFRSEWTTSAAVYLLDQARHESKMWLYPRTLRAWIQRLGVKAICQGPAGYDGSAGRDLSALLTLGDQLATVAGLMSRLSRLDPGRRDRTSWIQVRFETVDGVWAAVVDEDLFPLALPYSSDIVESRDILGVPGADLDPEAERGPLGLREAHAGESSGSPSRRDQPGPTRSILVANLLSHGDVPDGDLAAMDQTLTPVQVIGLRGFIGYPVDTLTRAHVGPVLSAVLHSLVNVGGGPSCRVGPSPSRRGGPRLQGVVGPGRPHGSPEHHGPGVTSGRGCGAAVLAGGLTRLRGSTSGTPWMRKGDSGAGLAHGGRVPWAPWVR